MIVFTNGVFDILHAGHVDYLERAKALGSTLIVGLNADESVRMLGKGPDRPLNHENDRLKVLRSLRCIDSVILFYERTPYRLIEMIRPHIYVKGGDYDMDKSECAALVRKLGGTAQALPFLTGRSTTKLVERIRSGIIAA